MKIKFVNLTVVFLFVFQAYAQKNFEGRVEGFVPNGYARTVVDKKIVKMLFPEDFRKDKPKIGSEFPTFAFIDLDGDSINSEMLKDKIAILNFTFVGCSGCKMEHPILKKVTEVYSDRKDIIFINFINSSPIRIKWYLKKHGDKGYISVPIDTKTYKDYFHIVTAPSHMFLVDGIVKENISAPLWSENSGQFIVNFIEEADKNRKHE